MTTNKMDFISKMFVVIIAYITAVITIEFTIVDFLYLMFIIACYIKYINISKRCQEEWQTFFFSL